MKWNQRSKFLFFYISLHALRVCVYPCMCFCLGVCINDSDDNLKAIQWKTNRQKLKPKLLSISLFQTPKVSEPGQEKVWKMSSRLVFFSRPNPKHPKLVGDPPFWNRPNGFNKLMKWEAEGLHIHMQIKPCCLNHVNLNPQNVCECSTVNY